MQTLSTRSLPHNPFFGSISLAAYLSETALPKGRAPTTQLLDSFVFQPFNPIEAEQQSEPQTSRSGDESHAEDDLQLAEPLPVSYTKASAMRSIFKGRCQSPDAEAMIDLIADIEIHEATLSAIRSCRNDIQEIQSQFPSQADTPAFLSNFLARVANPLHSFRGKSADRLWTWACLSGFQGVVVTHGSGFGFRLSLVDLKNRALVITDTTSGEEFWPFFKKYKLTSLILLTSPQSATLQATWYKMSSDFIEEYPRRMFKSLTYSPQDPCRLSSITS